MINNVIVFNGKQYQAHEQLMQGCKGCDLKYPECEEGGYGCLSISRVDGINCIYKLVFSED